MAYVDQVKELRKQGYQDPEIINQLQQQGVSPREINDALSQSTIKQAVADDTFPQTPNFSPAQTPHSLESTQEIGGMEGMQPSLINQPPAQEQSPQGALQPMTQEYSEGGGGYDQYGGGGYDQGYGEGDYSGGYDQGYGGGGGGGYGAPSNDIVTEITNQIVSEKMQKANEQLNSLTEFKTLLTTKVEKIDERLKQIEVIIDQLQMSLVRKANQQEQNVSDIKTEMRSMQDSFGKMVNPLTDTIRDMEDIIEKKGKKSTSKKKRAKKKKK